MRFHLTLRSKVFTVYLPLCYALLITRGVTLTDVDFERAVRERQERE